VVFHFVLVWFWFGFGSSDYLAAALAFFNAMKGVPHKSNFVRVVAAHGAGDILEGSGEQREVVKFELVNGFDFWRFVVLVFHVVSWFVVCGFGLISAGDFRVKRGEIGIDREGVVVSVITLVAKGIDRGCPLERITALAASGGLVFCGLAHGSRNSRLQANRR
jgi:hypothetical protein